MEKLKQLFTDHYVIPEEWLWVIFGVVVLLLLFFDLFLFNRKNEVPNFWHTLNLCIIYILAACVFGVFIIYEEGVDKGMDFFTGFLVEKSLSLDNIFIMSLIFSSLGVPRMYQHRVLFWGILGAIVMRALLILVGETLISNFHWVLYVFSAFLVYTGVKMLLHKGEEEPAFEETRMFKFFSKIFHVTGKIHGEHFFVKENGKHYITPLFFALITIETMDVIFALDSIPRDFPYHSGRVYRLYQQHFRHPRPEGSVFPAGGGCSQVQIPEAGAVDHPHLHRFEDFCAEGSRF